MVSAAVAAHNFNCFRLDVSPVHDFDRGSRDYSEAGEPFDQRLIALSVDRGRL